VEKEGSKKMKIMTESRVGNVLYYIGKNIHDGKYRKIPDYIEQMLALNNVFCYRCRNEIELGSAYDTAGTAARLKYYHHECLDSLYQ